MDFRNRYYLTPVNCPSPMATERLLPGAPRPGENTGVSDLETDGEISLRPRGAAGEETMEYDYARGSHFYEDLPVKDGKGSVDSLSRTGPPAVEQSSWPSTISTSTTQLSNNNNTADSIRKRHNPLYDAVQRKHPSPLPPSTVISPADKALSKRVACLCACVVLAFIIAVVSLVIVVYIFITVTPETYEETNKSHIAQYDQLKADFDHLSQKYNQLSSMLLGDISDQNDSDVSLAVRVARNQMLLQQFKENLTNQQTDTELLKLQVLVIEDLKNNLQQQHVNISMNSDRITMETNRTNNLTQQLNGLKEQVLNVSKMEGPQGPQGVGNLSACYYVNYTQIMRNAIEMSSVTNKQPSIETLQDMVVLSATCSVTGGTFASLLSEPVASLPNTYQYKCSCSGVDAVVRDRTCFLHLWLCPRLS